MVVAHYHCDWHGKKTNITSTVDCSTYGKYFSCSHVTNPLQDLEGAKPPSVDLSLHLLAL